MYKTIGLWANSRPAPGSTPPAEDHATGLTGERRRHAPSRLEDALRIVADPDRQDDAVQLLGIYLSGHNPHLAKRDRRLREAAYWYVRLTAYDPHNTLTVGWALYNYRTTRLPSDEEPRIIDPARTLAEVVRYRSKHPVTSALHEVPVTGPDPLSRGAAMLAARGSAARLLHINGLCDRARREAISAMLAWVPCSERPTSMTSESYDRRLQSLPEHLVGTLHMLDLCGRVSDAIALLNTYTPVLPVRGTHAYDVLLAQGEVLGDHGAAHRHQGVCSRRRPGARPRNGQDVRSAFLRVLTSKDPRQLP